MWFLIGTTITASFFDSLNPSAIAQQMLLQAMVKNKRHIWFFIFGIAFANLSMGLAVYYGIAMWISRLIANIMEIGARYVYGAALGLGLFSLASGIRLIVNVKRRNGGNETNNGISNGKPPAHISPLSLFFMRAAFCAVELTSAFPYFGFLAVLTNYHLMFPLVLIFILLYNFIYVLPLILLYFGYKKLQGTVIIRKLERVLGRVSSYIVPVAVSLIGFLLLFYGVSFLL